MRKFLIYFIFIVLLFSLSMTGCGKNNSTNYTTVTVDPGNVIYYGNTNDGGAVPIDDNDYEIGDIVTVKHNENYLVKDFKKFTGWNTQSDGSGDSYQPEDNITVEDENNIELYAQWDNSPYKISSGGEILD